MLAQVAQTEPHGQHRREIHGRSAADQAITPKASGERERDHGLGLAGRAAWVSQMRRGLAVGEGEDSDA